MSIQTIASKSSINSLLSSADRVVLYGAGNVGRDVLGLLTDLGVNVHCFIDAKELQIQDINGIPIYNPGDQRFSDEFKRETRVILSLFNAYVSVPAILENLKKLGWKNVTTFLQLHRLYPNELGRRYWLTDLDFYPEKEAFYTKALDIWADEKSRNLYESILNFRFTLNYSLLPEPDLNGQYFPDDVPSWNLPLDMVDCGAYDGDTLNSAMTKKITIGKVAAFEPDENNFKKLAKTVQAINKDIILFPCGVWSHCSQLRFSSGNGSGSAISSVGDTVIQCVSIDEALSSFAPNLIKMDIEGAEYAALRGARKTIQKHRPGLAICLYHNPEHLWQIPLLIAEWGLNYKFYLRCHYYSGFELVFYAIPE